MTFFDRKEEVLEVELTPYGKYLLSLGELRPVYYSFFDDDIVYDSNCAGHPENQNDTEGRIKDSVRTHCQVVFRDVEDKVESAYNWDKRKLQNFFEREYALFSELGIADYYSNYSPSWDANLLKGVILDSSPIHTDAGPTYKIPQINVVSSADSSYIRYDKKVGYMSPGPAKLVDDESLREIIPLPTEEYIEINKDFLLLELNENNSIFQKENFEIELFRVEVQPRGEDREEILIPLKFEGPRINQETQYVDYFLNLDADFEIDTQTLCKYKGVDSTKGLFIQRVFDCPPEPGEAPAGQYETDVTDTGEVCT